MNSIAPNTPESSARPLIALAGGKSGGHVFPALAVGEELERLGASLVFFGMAEGMESRLAKERGLDFVSIDAAAMVGQGLVGKMNALAKLAVNAMRARASLKRCGVTGVLSTGGFVSAPTVLGARLLNLPVVLLEPNADPGAANRVLSRFAKVAAVAFESTIDQLRCPARVTGVPVRSAFFEVPRVKAPAGRFHLLIVGGSQGAAKLNQELPAILADVLQGGLVVHQCGADHQASTVAAWQEALQAGDSTHAVRSTQGVDGSVHLQDGRAEGTSVQVRPFIDQMEQAFAEAHIVISRAGAITLAELAAAGRGSILIPLPLAGDHQRQNARRQAQGGGAFMVEQDQLGEVGQLLSELLERPEQVAELGVRASSGARRDAAQTIAQMTRKAVVDTFGEERWAA